MWVLYLVFSIFSVVELILFFTYYSSTYLNVSFFPEKTTSRILAVTVIFCMFCLRACYSIFYFLAIPNWTSETVSILQRAFLYVLAGWWYLVIALPSVFSLYYILFYEVGDVKEYSCNKDIYKKIVCILPVYNEDFELLRQGFDSIFLSDYPSDMLEINISFDDERVSELYLKTLEYFKIKGIPRDPSYSFIYNTSTVHIHRFKHGGKKHVQMKSWEFIENRYYKQNCNFYVLLNDSDNIIKPNAFHNFAVYMDKNPDKIACCGYMSCLSKSLNIVSMTQDAEYVSCEINRFFEMNLGTVNCLPGAFTIIRYKYFRQLTKEYFEPFEEQSITHFHQRNLGEDRYMTHLFHKKFPRNSIGFCPTARCKTDPPNDLGKFIKQRRRWALGSIGNEAYMICTPDIWKKFPLMMIYKLLQTCWRSTTISQSLVATYGIITTINSSQTGKNIFLISVLIPICLAWFTSCLYAYKIQHYKVIIIWPFMIMFYTVMYLFVDFYTIWTWRKKSWGSRQVV